MSIKGIALVTGAAQGIGRAVALRLAKDGFDVAVNDVSINSEKLETLVDEIKKKGRASSKYVADVSQEEQVKKMVELVVAEHGGLDIVRTEPSADGPPVYVEEWDRVMNINARGPFLCYKYAGIQMIKQGRGGRIIGASLFAGKQGVTGQPAYSASKFAVRGLTQAAALEFGAHGITVNSYAPGAVETPMVAASDVSLSLASTTLKGYTFTSHIRPSSRNCLPSNGLGTIPEDIADLVSFLVSRGSQFITVVCRTLYTSGRYTAAYIALHVPALAHTTILLHNFKLITMSCKGTALVTGAGQGIGRAVALRLAEDGFDVAVNDIFVNSDKLETLVNEIQQKGRASSKHVADVSNEDQVKEMVELAIRQHGGLDALENLASTDAVQVSLEEWDRVMNVNARGAFLCYKYAGIQMIKQGRGGRIIGASSHAGKQGAASQPVYSASKFAVRGLTQAAASEFGAHGITVNAYAPGPIDTPMGNCSSGGYNFDSIVPVKRPKVLEETPQQLPNDVADLVSFLASKESGFITGAYPFECDAVNSRILIKGKALVVLWRDSWCFQSYSFFRTQISINGGIYFD
ncbi:NAD(P)-binding protein [Mycena crocata]|nr:NAD(P)-binding protein [Mycena crocata]